MTDLLAVTVFPALILLFALHVWRLGSYYVEFDGRMYLVWQRRFLGYNDLDGFFLTENAARARIEELKKNPPRIIKV